MDKAWQKYAEMAVGLTDLTRQRAEQVVRSLVKQGEVAADLTEKTVDELLRRSEQNRRALTTLVRSETEKAVGRLGLAPRKEVERLENQVRRLERQLADARGGGSSASTGTPAKKTSAAKKSSATKKSSAAKKNSAARKSSAAKKPAVAKKSAAAKKSAKTSR